jgi:photosystem II stability/assembly factor-like uncharacterized protein
MFGGCVSAVPRPAGTGENQPGKESVGDNPRLRMEAFYRQRGWPEKTVPGNARLRALRDRDEAMRRVPQARTRAIASWQPAGPQPTTTDQFGPLSGRVDAIAVDPRSADVVYIGASQGGVWKTIDGGANWTPITDFQPSLAIEALAIAPSNPDVVYAGTGEENPNAGAYFGAGLLKSSDGGATWTVEPGPFVAASGAPTGNARIASLAVHPLDERVVVAGVDGFGTAGIASGIYRSTDGGATWTVVKTTAAAVLSLQFDATGSTAFASVYQGGVLKSVDGGATWSPSNGTSRPLPLTAAFRVMVSFSRSKPLVVYAALDYYPPAPLPHQTSIYKSRDGGQNWDHLPAADGFCTSQCWYDMNFAVHPGNPDVLFAGGVDPVWRSLDGGASWTTNLATAGGAWVHADLHAMAFSSAGDRLYVGTDGGVWSTTTVQDPVASVRWNDLNGRLALTQFYSGISVNPLDPNSSFGGAQDNGMQTHTSGLEWSRIYNCDGGATALDVGPAGAVRKLYAFIECGGGNPVLVWTPGGQPWAAASSGIGTEGHVWMPPLVIDPGNPSILYYGTDRLYQTRNGANWTAISQPADLITAIAVAPSATATVYFGTQSGKVTTDPGGSWTALRGLPGRSVTGIAVDPANAGLAYVSLSGFSGGHVFKLGAGGAFVDSSTGLPDTPVNDIVVDPDVPGALYAATDVGVWASVDGAGTWQPLGTALPNVAVMSVRVQRSSRTLRAATFGRSMWDLALPPLQPTLAVRKVLLPRSDPGRFDLKIDGSTCAAGAGNGGGCPPRTVAPGNHTVAEAAAAGTNPALYDPPVFGGACNASGVVSLSSAQAGVCLITNRGAPRLTVRKVLVPRGDPGRFDVFVDGTRALASVANGSTGALVLAPGTHTVRESAAAGTSLADYSAHMFGPCAPDPVRPNTWSVLLSRGMDVTCTIANVAVDATCEDLCAIADCDSHPARCGLASPRCTDSCDATSGACDTGFQDCIAEVTASGHHVHTMLYCYHLYRQCIGD